MRSQEQALIAALFLFLLVLTLALIAENELGGPGLNSGRAEVEAEIPAEILVDALKSGGLSVLLRSTFQEKHNFAKGLPTRFGQMSFSTDDFLKHKAGWSEEKIHRVGFKFGFSKLWSNRAQ